MSNQAELLLDIKCAVGESPVWQASEQALYWVDIPDGKLYRWSAATAQLASWQAPSMLACIAPRASGGWVAGMQTGVFSLTISPDAPLTCRKLAGVAHSQSGMRFNDGRCDRQGRFLAGTMVMDMSLASRAGCIYRLDASGQLTSLLDGLITPNGMAFSPDGQTMYLSDSHSSVQLVWAFDYDTETGTPSNRRVFIDMNNFQGRPDGAAVDADGCYWICGNDAGLVHRFTPAGKLDYSVSVPVKKPAMCAFGGADLSTLYVTSIRPDNMDLADQPLAGGLFAISTSTNGVAEPPLSF